MLDSNPIESLQRVWAMRYGKFLAMAAMLVLCIAVLVSLLWAAHVALLSVNSKKGIGFVAQVVSLDGVGVAALWGVVLLVGLWAAVLVSSVVSKTDEQIPHISLPVVLSVTDYEIGIAGYRGYPDKPVGAAMLCLWVVISPACTPINKIDLLVGNSPPIPSINWTGKPEAAFRVLFDVSEWHYKGKEQVELVVKAGSYTHRSDKKLIDFCMEVFCRHPI